ncbi:unnamed protein product [Nippostrongylus brasiliensis]|uniref:Uncharacterized protein n=1 Tax=Nippostrongylus brasiliensis TaxID=27835 RepID=A0A0N4Y899_NIPBR|nr:unnamed protein product [Nippostrongylus brasiliensis]
MEDDGTAQMTFCDPAKKGVNDDSQQLDAIVVTPGTDGQMNAELLEGKVRMGTNEVNIHRALHNGAKNRGMFSECSWKEADGITCDKR